MKKYKTQLLILILAALFCAGILAQQLLGESTTAFSKTMLCDSRANCLHPVPKGVCVPGGTCAQ